MSFLSAPKVPSPASIAKAQVNAAKQIAPINFNYANPNTTDIYGNTVNYSQSGTDAQGNPIISAVANLSPEQQALLNQLIGARSGIGVAGQNLASNIGANYGNIPDFSNSADSLTREMVGREAAIMDPYYTQQNNFLENRLRNQGLTPGTPAFDQAMRTLQQNQNQSRGQFVNQAWNSAFQNAVTGYKTPLEAIASIMGMMGPMIGGVGTKGIGQAAAPDMNAAFQNQFNNQTAQNNAMWQAIGQIAGTAMGLPTGVGSATIGSSLGSSLGAGLSSILGLV